MRVLVVGGAGYIGSVTSEILLKNGHEVVVLDNLSRGHRELVPVGADLHVADTSDTSEIFNILRLTKPDAVMHFAALSLVGESVKEPALYFKNNVSNGLNLLDAMIAADVKNLIFSSTAAVYGEPSGSPISEDFELKPTNPYGESKLAFEKILRWYGSAYPINYTCLRYFNAAGATDNAGECHSPETHLIPLVLDAASGQRSEITVFGDDYPTADGTCIRDYIHVVDLAEAHILALEHMRATGTNNVFNLGNGHGHSVLEVIESARRVTGRDIKIQKSARRMGDPSILVASNQHINKTLGWQPKLGNIDDIVRDAWSWHHKISAKTLTCK